MIRAGGRLRSLLAATGLWAACAWAAPSVEVSPLRLDLASGKPAELEVRNVRGTLRTRTNVGTLESVSSGAGVSRFRYLPPAEHIPGWALLAFIDERPGKPPDVSLVQVELIGSTDLSIDTEPGAKVTVEVAGKEFGPQKADAQGRVSVAVKVPPGNRTATVHATAHGRTTARALTLAPPESPWVAAFVPEAQQAGNPGYLWVGAAEPFAASGPLLELGHASVDRLPSPLAQALFRVTPAAGVQRLAAVLRAPGAPEPRAQVAAEVLPPAPVAPEAPPHPFDGWQADVAVGGFVAGGSNGGLALAASAGHGLPGPAWLHRFIGELEVGVRFAGQSVDGAVGGVDAQVTALTLDVGVRAPFFVQPKFHLDARLGLGAMPFWNHTSGVGSADFSQSGVGFDGFLSVQAAYRLGIIEPFIELRGEIAPAVTPFFDARLGGFVGMVGVRGLP